MDARWNGLTASGTLPIGIYYAGTRHRDFTLRVSLTGDLIGAQEDHPNGTVRLIALELFRRQLLRVGEIPADALTLDLLRAELTDIDLGELERVDESLTKKLRPDSGDSTTGDASSTSSSGTAIA